MSVNYWRVVNLSKMINPHDNYFYFFLWRIHLRRCIATELRTRSRGWCFMRSVNIWTWIQKVILETSLFTFTFLCTLNYKNSIWIPTVAFSCQVVISISLSDILIFHLFHRQASITVLSGGHWSKILTRCSPHHRCLYLSSSNLVGVMPPLWTRSSLFIHFPNSFTSTIAHNSKSPFSFGWTNSFISCFQKVLIALKLDELRWFRVLAGWLLL